MSTVKFNLELLNTEVEDAALNAEITAIRTELNPIFRRYNAVAQKLTAINVGELKEQHEQLKKQIKAKNKEIEAYQISKSKLYQKLEEAMHRSNELERRWANLVQATPDEDSYPSQEEIDAHKKKVEAAYDRAASAGRHVADLQSEYQRLTNQMNRNQLDTELRNLMQQEKELREKIKQLESTPTSSAYSTSYGAGEYGLGTF